MRPQAAVGAHGMSLPSGSCAHSASVGDLAWPLGSRQGAGRRGAARLFPLPQGHVNQIVGRPGGLQDVCVRVIAVRHGRPPAGPSGATGERRLPRARPRLPAGPGGGSRHAAPQPPPEGMLPVPRRARSSDEAVRSARAVAAAVSAVSARGRRAG